MHSIESKEQVLIVDRDAAIVEPLRLGLADLGFVVRAITDKAAALAAIAERPPQLIFIDWNLPGFAGPELVQASRRADTLHGVGVIILTALSGEHDIVNGLNLGADDYIAKPFSSREAIARAQAVLRTRLRTRRPVSLTCGDLALDPATSSAMAHRRRLSLSPVEYRLLEFLVKHPGRAFNRAQLLVQVWGADSGVDERTVDVNVQRLRKLLSAPGCDSYIQTVRGFGYRFGAPADLNAN